MKGVVINEEQADWLVKEGVRYKLPFENAK